MPAVQNPHWSAWWSWNARCSGPGARPSIVRTSQPSAWTASIRHERTGSPSSWTVHAPQTPCSQPTLVPVRPVVADEVARAACAARPRPRARAPLSCGPHARPAWTSARRVSSATSARRCGSLDRRGGERGRPRARAPSTALGHGARRCAPVRASRRRPAPRPRTTAARLEQSPCVRRVLGAGRGAPPARGRDAITMQQLAGPERRRVSRCSEERVGAGGSGGTAISTSSTPRSSWRASSASSAQRQFGARVGVRDRAADRAARAGRGVADVPHGLGEQRPVVRRRAASARARPGARSRRSAASPSVRRITPRPAIRLMSTSRAGRATRG